MGEGRLYAMIFESPRRRRRTQKRRAVAIRIVSAASPAGTLYLSERLG